MRTQGAFYQRDRTRKPPGLKLIGWEHRRATLIAHRDRQDEVPLYRFDIKLRGEDETVFFDI